MANSGQVVSLLIQVTETGAIKVQTVAQDLEKLGKTATDSSAGMVKLSDAASTTSTSISAMLGALASAGVVKFGTDILLTAARTEMLGVAMNVIGKNAGISQSTLSGLVGNVSKLGITTQETYTNLARMIQADLDLAKATDLARVAQNAAVIAGTDSSKAYESLLHGVTTLQPEVLRMFGITVNLEAEYRKFAATTGRTVDALSMQEKQAILLNAVLREGGKMADAYEAAMGTAGKALTSLTRLQEEAKNALGTGLLPTMKGGIDITADLLKGFNALPPELQRVAGTATLAAGGFAAIEGTVLGLTAAGILGAGSAALFAPWIAGAAAIAGVAALAQGGKGTSLLGLAKMDDLTESERTLIRYGASLDSVLRRRAEAGASGVSAAKQKALLSGITPDDVERNRTRLGLAEQKAAEQREADLLKYRDKAAQIEAEIAAARVKAELDPMARIDLERQAALNKAFADYTKDLREFGQSAEGKAAAARLYQTRISTAEAQAGEERRKIQEKQNAQDIAGYVAMAEAQLAVDWQGAQDTLKRQAEEVAAREKVNQQAIDGDVQQANAVIEENDRVQTYLNANTAKQVALREQAFSYTLKKLDEETHAVQDAVNAGVLTREQASELTLRIEERRSAAILSNYEREIAESQRATDAALKAKGIAVDQALALAAYGVNREAAIRQTNTQNLITVLLGQSEAQSQYWLAVEAGARTAYDRIGTTSQNIAKGVEQAFATIQGSLSDGFFAVLTGKFDDLGKVAENFGQSMIRVFSDVLASEAAKGLLKGITGIGGWLGSILSFAEGGIVPNVPGRDPRDTIPALLRPGEIVLKPEIAEQFQQLLDIINPSYQLTPVEVSAIAGPTAEAGAIGVVSPTSYFTASPLEAATAAYAGELVTPATSFTGMVAPLVAPALAIASTLYGAWSNSQAIKQAEQIAGHNYEILIDSIFRAAPEIIPALQGGNPEAMSAMADALAGTNFIETAFTRQIAQYGIGGDVARAITMALYPAKPYDINYSDATGGSRDAGGPVWPGGSFLIGAGVRERLDIGPGGYGYVTPLSGSGGGGANITVQVDLRGSIVGDQLPASVVRQIAGEVDRLKRVNMSGRN